MNLNCLETKLRGSTNNQIEYYEAGKKKIKKHCEVYEDVCRVRAFLLKHNIGKGKRVAILGKNCYEWVLIDLACVLTGVITVPLETGVTYDLKDLVNEFEFAAVFTNLDQYISLLSDGVISFNKVIEDSNKYDSSEVVDVFTMPDFELEDVFTLIFTSGTSGKPKCIEVKKKSFDHLISVTQELFEFKPNDRFLVFLPLSIYLERCYIYSSILLGFNVILTPLEYIFHSIQNDKPSIIIGVPYFFENVRAKFLEKIRSNFFYLFIYETYNFLCFIGLTFLFRKRFSPFIKAWGGNIRYLLTGSAPIAKSTLLFYKKMGLTIYEGFGMSEIGGMLTLNSPGHVKLGSVGKAFPGKEVMIDADGQILVKSDLNANNKYFKSTKLENDTTYINENTVATGDIGYIDSEGYVYINGRIKDIIITSLGKKIHPTQIEQLIMDSGLFKNCLVYGENKPFLIAILVTKNAESTNLEIKECLKKVNSELPSDERILDFIVNDEPFTVENGLLTTSLKLNRQNVVKKIRKEIDELYK